MMSEIDFMTTLHKSTQRDYLARVNDHEYPKDRAAVLAKNLITTIGMEIEEFAMADITIKNRWVSVANSLIKHYQLSADAKILDIGCGKGYLLYDLMQLLPGSQVYGLDISDYAIRNCKEELKGNLIVGNAQNLPWPDDYFDLVISINTLHNLYAFELENALKEMERGKTPNIYVLKVIEMKKKKLICCIGRLHVKRLTLPKSGNGGSKRQTILGITHSFISNKIEFPITACFFQKYSKNAQPTHTMGFQG